MSAVAMAGAGDRWPDAECKNVISPGRFHFFTANDLYLQDKFHDPAIPGELLLPLHDTSVEESYFRGLVPVVRFSSPLSPSAENFEDFGLVDLEGGWT